MGKNDANSTFDLDMDPQFSENFYKNIEKALGNSDVEETDAFKESTFEFDSKSDFVKPASDAMEGGTEYTRMNKDNGVEKRNSIGTTGDLPSEKRETVQPDIEDELVDINEALAKQICNEMDHIGSETAKAVNKKRLFKIQSGIILTVLCLVGFGFFFGFTKPGNQLLMKMGVNLTGTIWSTMTGNFDDGTDVVEDTDYLDADDLNSDAEELDASTIVWPDHPGIGRHEEGVYNVLLMGEEAIGSGSGRGRTDVIVIATLNTVTKEVKLTSLMRDMYVQIPGYQDNKLNSAYEKGGLDLLYETIALNFDLRLDGCAMVNFENFEKIVDKLGGLEITLTEGEAKYLNSTNYISNPLNRNVVAGKQLLNGNQVLGYSRVRKRATITGNNNDYGRTDRHRIVLNAIFDKYKTKSKVELASTMVSLLPMITTDIDSGCFELLLNTFIEMGTTEMSQLRIPADNAFDDAKVRGMSVLIPDLSANREILHSFIFGNDTTAAATDITDTNVTTSSTTN